MTGSDVTLLPGLPGDNPLGFLAAMGVQVALADQGADPRLHWTDLPIPHPVLSPACGLEEVARAVFLVARDWLEGPALDNGLKADLKLSPREPDETRDYLSSCRDAGPSGLLGLCLLAEGVASETDRNKAKPSDLYFTAGQQKFVSMARTILGEVTEEEIADDMAKPWRYHSKRESLMWDTVDDRLHALSHSDPTKPQNPKRTNPGAEALAVLGLSRYPCFAAPQGTLTQGCSGRWKRGRFVWPLWTTPVTGYAVRSLLAQASAPAETKAALRRSEWYRSWGLSRVMQSQIRRSDQGGYGTFGPPRVIWQRD